MINKFTLGTAQLMSNYGISNKEKTHSKINAFKILQKSVDLGIKSYDTSPKYSNSESILGEFFFNNKKKISFTTKLNSISVNIKSKEKKKLKLNKIIEKSLFKSLGNLKVDYIDNYFIHDENDYFIFNKEITNTLLLYKKKYFNNLGVSVYNLELCEKIINDKLIDIIQIPLNIFDNRFLPLITKAKKNNIKTQVRSMFLQGMIFLKKNEYKQKINIDYELISKFNDYCLRQKKNPYQISIMYVLQQKNISNILLGTDNIYQLINNLNFINSLNTKQLNNKISFSLKDISEKIINPKKW